MESGEKSYQTSHYEVTNHCLASTVRFGEVRNKEMMNMEMTPYLETFDGEKRGMRESGGDFCGWSGV